MTIYNALRKTRLQITFKAEGDNLHFLETKATGRSEQKKKGKVYAATQRSNRSPGPMRNSLIWKD